MIRYREGYKYQLVEDYYHALQVIRPEVFIFSNFIRLDTTGDLWIIAGYAWDGPSGPAFDTPNFMRASLVHDALYQLMRSGHLPQSLRGEADEEMRRICLAAGMSKLRAWWCWSGVRFFGGAAAREAQPVREAP